MTSLFAQRIPFFIEIRCAADEQSNASRGAQIFYEYGVTLNTRLFMRFDSIAGCFFLIAATRGCRGDQGAAGRGMLKRVDTERERERERGRLTRPRYQAAKVGLIGERAERGLHFSSVV